MRHKVGTTHTGRSYYRIGDLFWEVWELVFDDKGSNRSHVAYITRNSDGHLEFDPLGCRSTKITH